jgi:hypothetical protein
LVSIRYQSSTDISGSLKVQLVTHHHHRRLHQCRATCRRSREQRRRHPHPPRSTAASTSPRHSLPSLSRLSWLNPRRCCRCPMQLTTARPLRAPPLPLRLHTAMQKLRIVTLGFRVGDAHEAVSRRPPIALDTVVARTHMYTYAAKVWDSSIVQGPFSVAPCQTLLVPNRKQRFIRCMSGLSPPSSRCSVADDAKRRTQQLGGERGGGGGDCVGVAVLPRSGGGLLTILAVAPPQLHRRVTSASRNVRFCRYRFAATDLNSKATWFGNQ